MTAMVALRALVAAHGVECRGSRAVFVDVGVAGLQDEKATNWCGAARVRDAWLGALDVLGEPVVESYSAGVVPGLLPTPTPAFPCQPCAAASGEGADCEVPAPAKTCGNCDHRPPGVGDWHCDAGRCATSPDATACGEWERTVPATVRPVGAP